MEVNRHRESSDRDQLWASLRTLRDQIDELHQSAPPYSDRQTHLIRLLARIVAAELDFRETQAIAD